MINEILLYLDRSATALILVEEGAQVGVCDASGLSAITLMIEKMPPVAKEALNQLHRTDRPNRKQYFYLNLLEPQLPGLTNCFARSPMVVSDNLTHVYLVIVLAPQSGL